jgi:hypothetical protein
LGWVLSQQTEESKMKKSFKLGVPAATFVVAAFLGAMTTTTTAQAGEFCRTDVSGHMTSCGFNTLAQCQAASSGIGGDCFRDPNFKGNTSNATNGNSSNSFAYQPDGSRPVRRGRYGQAPSAQ